jgi:hypothetical protein
MRTANLIMLCVLAAIAATTLMTYAPRNREPAYQGKMLQDTNDPVRCFAAQELAHICGERREEVVIVLKACLRDTNQSVRMECTKALQQLGEVPPDSQTAGNESLRAVR